jgi:pimeloyl-ACP methyl ester carboxylesterase
VHGLCMNDLQWHRDGHDHGRSLADSLGYTPLYLHYNSGLHISTNGHQLAEQLEHLIEEWPVPIRELAVIGHSMGGLVARSACHYAHLRGHDWPRQLQKLVFLGTPHHGTPLERAGSWVDALADISPYTAPFSRIGKLRSNGVQDLRYGTIVDTDWEDDGPKTAHEQSPVPLPRGVRCFAIAARQHQQSGTPASSLWGDGLVPVQSALGQHEDPGLSLPIPPSHRQTYDGLTHFDLLGSQKVGDQIRRWLRSS